MKRAFCLKFTKFAKNCLFTDFENIMLVVKRAASEFFRYFKTRIDGKTRKNLKYR